MVPVMKKARREPGSVSVALLRVQISGVTILALTPSSFRRLVNGGS